MIRHLFAAVVCVAMGTLFSASAIAGGPVAIIGNAATSFAASNVGNTTTQTITLTFNAEGNSGENAQVGALAFGGANAADFSIIGGTCAQNTTQLSSTTPTCTVIVQYRPSTSGAESAQLIGSCTQIALVGGFTLACTGTSGALTSLSGAILAAVVSLPMLDPRMLTMMCLAMLGVGVYFARRKRDAR